MVIQTTTKILFVLTLCLSVFSFSQESAANGTACDPEYMQAMKARAWMEAQREISQNQNLIFKPDSVLEYSCFQGKMSNFDTSFSGGVNTGGVQSSLSTHAANYPNAALNGRTGISGPCKSMQSVWKSAREMNFIDRQHDGFFDFDFYANMAQDPKQIVGGQAFSTSYSEASGIAYNQDAGKFVLPAGQDGVIDANVYKEDPVVTHLDKIKAGTCSAPIPTGLMVQRADVNGGSPYEEHVCSNPGCVYNPSGGKCQ